jgi:hypothetical protein
VFHAQTANLHGFQAVRDGLPHLFEYFDDPRPHYFAVFACFGAEIADETSVLPADPIKILDLCIDETRKRLSGGSESLRRVLWIIARMSSKYRSRTSRA